MKLLALYLLFCFVSAAQQLPARRTIRAIGEGTITARLDQARITFQVVTRSSNASDAAGRNATAASNVMGELRRILGGTADIRTTAYNLSASQRLPGSGSGQGPSPGPVSGPPSEYNAESTIQAIVLDLSLVGSVVDAGLTAGATSLHGVSLGFRDEDSAKAQALLVAGRKARAKAEAIAQGLGLRLGNVILAHEATDPPVDLSTALVQLPGSIGGVFQPLLGVFGAPKLEVHLMVEFEIMP